MTKKLSCYEYVLILALFLSGCISSSTEQLPAPVKQIKPDTDQLSQPTWPILTVPSVPLAPLRPSLIEHQDQTSQLKLRIRHYNWNSIMQQMVDKMIKAQGVSIGSVLLVASINNRTNGCLNLGEATETLRNTLENNGKFTLVSTQQLSVAKQQLGLSQHDNLGSRSKAIGIARNVGAQYVLYSNATGNVNLPSLQMQLMLVQTGENIWSGEGTVTQL